MDLRNEQNIIYFSMHKVQIIFLLLFVAFQTKAQQTEKVLKINADTEVFSLLGFAEVLADSTANITFEDIRNSKTNELNNAFFYADSPQLNTLCDVHWVRFSLWNESSAEINYKISVTFTDKLDVYIPSPDGDYLQKTTGDLMPIDEREVPVGQMLFKNLQIPANQQLTFYLRMETQTEITQQHKGIALRSLKVFSEKGFYNTHSAPRYYQAFFYGAIFIMFFYNLFIYFSLKSISYLYYVLFLLVLGIFFLSNAGYLVELFLPNYPRTDLYIRFFSTPLLLFSFLLFSQGYLKTKEYAPFLHKIIIGLMILMALIGLAMFLGFWAFGRTVVIFSAAGIFLFLVYVTAVCIYKGFTPARFFLIANILLLVGGIVFALERVSIVVHNPLTQYSMQLAVLLQVSLFSVGLADRINLFRKQLAEQGIAQAKLEKEQEIERKRLIEEKNKELEAKVIERTAEVVSQKEQIEKSNKAVLDSIRYAKRIQTAILVEEAFFKVHFADAFIMYRPKDIVCGDFYWFAAINENLKIVCAADCTGHGVSGAFMTVLGNTLLSEIISTNSVFEADKILYELDNKIISTLHNSHASMKSNDGMDIGVMVFDFENKKLQFSGAKIPLYKYSQGELKEIKPSKSSIGGSGPREKAYELNEITLKTGDKFYISSDGYKDQFGGEHNRKFQSQKFRELLVEIQMLSMNQQKQRLEQAFDDWKGDHSQIDDVMVIGIEV